LVLPSAPEPISALHITEGFDCGKSPLNNWLKIRALSNHQNNFTAVMVIHENLRVLGFYGLAPTSILPTSLPRNVRTGQPPDPIPCLLLGQLAVDTSCIGTGVGTGLLKHALLRSLEAAKLVGGRALLVNAVDDDASAFWKRRGFVPTRDDPMVMFRAMADVAKNL
jgi:GNAT superfamily N-acetyltransferase